MKQGRVNSERQAVRTIVRVIDSFSEWTGKIGRWFVLALVLVVAYGVFMRYVFSAPNIWAYEIAIMLGSCVYVFGLSYAHRYDAHVRVDIIYARLPPRWRGIIDVAGSLLLFFPIMILVTYVSATWAWDAWVLGERLAFTGWYPPAGPLRTALAIGFFIFALQGVAQFTRALHLLRWGKPYD